MDIKLTLEELRKLGVEGERKLLLAQFMESYQKGLPEEAELIPRELLLLEVSDLYEELLKVQYEKDRLASFVCASGNFSSFVQYCNDTEGTTTSEYAKVVEEIGTREVASDNEEEEYVQYETSKPAKGTNLS